MKYELQGTTIQLLNVELEENETIYSESGRLIFMSDNVNMETTTKGGFWKGLKRKFMGESFFLVTFKAQAGKGIISFGSEFPGKIIPINLKENEEIIAQKDAFLCAQQSVNFDATFTKKIGAGFLGGEGLILIKIRGPGKVFLNVGGEVTEIPLKTGEKVRIDTSNIAAFTRSIDYNVERVKGIRNMIWGGEGLFLATCTGPGKVWVQSLPISEFASKIAQYLPHQGGNAAAAGAVGGIVGGMLRR